MTPQLIKILFFFFIAIAVALEAIADFLLKKWAIENRGAFLAIGLIVYFIGTLFWAYSLRFEFLSKSISVFTVLNLVVVALVGMIFFKEDLSLLNKAGIAFGALSVILVEL